MKALISDVHSNLEALEAVLEDIRAKEIAEIVCIGDVVGYGPDPERCIDLLKEVGTVLLGNHDEAVLHGEMEDFNLRAKRVVEWTKQRLNENISSDPLRMERWNFLERMKTTVTDGNVLYVHGSPRSPTREYVVPRDARNREKMQDIFARIQGVCFAGHTHIPGVFTEKGEFLPPGKVDNLYFLGEEKAFINVGSVGQPRDGDPRACYVTFDGDAVVFRRVPYDVERTRAKIYAIPEIDNFLGDRLQAGR